MTQVLILNSGSGSRMGELTRNNPKCLVELTGGETILSRQLRFLQALGMQEVIITTGPFGEQVREYLAELFPQLGVSFVGNPRYLETNYIYSLLLAADLVDDELLLLHGDMVFEPVVLDKLMVADSGNWVLIKAQEALPEKDFKAEIRNGRIRKIGVDLFSPESVFLLPIYRLTKSAFQAWKREMKRFESENNLQVYAENALNNLLADLVLKPVELGEDFCMEIDDADDLATARHYLSSGRET